MTELPGIGSPLNRLVEPLQRRPGFAQALVDAAKLKGPDMEKKWKDRVETLLAKDEHLWKKGLSAKEAEELRKNYQERYRQ